MSDQVNPNPDETNDEVTNDEVEESKRIDIRALGIEPLSTPIPVIGKLYRKFVQMVKDGNEKRKSEKADPSDPTVLTNTRLKDATSSKDENLSKSVATSKAIVSGVAETLFLSLEKDNTLLTSFVVLNELRSLLSDVEDNHEYFFARAVQAEKDKQGITVTPAEELVNAKLTAVALSNLLQNRINIAQAMGDELPENLFKVSDSGRTSYNTDIIPRLPKLDMGDAAPKKSVSNVRLAFRWKHTGSETIHELDPSYTLNDVAHNVVSSGAYRISGATIAKMLKDAKHGIGATETEWELKFETGSLFGKKVSAE